MFPRKYRIHALLVLICLLIIFYPMYRDVPDEQKAAAARAGALEFLSLIDNNQYVEARQRAAGLLRDKISEEDWLQQLQVTRARAGNLLEREESTISFSTQAKDSPDGEYILLMYRSRFEKRAEALETLTLMLQTDKRWRVAGYFIK